MSGEGIHLAFTSPAHRFAASLLHRMKLFSAFLLFSVVVSHGAVTPSGLNRSRYTNTVTITATGTAATLDGAPFPLSAATAVTAVGFHDLAVTDGGVTTSYKFIVKNSERGGTEDGIPTMRPWQIVMDAPSAFADSTLSLMAPAAYPKNLPIPIVARLTKGASFGPAAGDPHFLNGRVRAGNVPASSILLRRGWGSTILPAATTAGSAAYEGVVHARTAATPTVIEDTTSWTTKTGALTGSENWGSNARIYVTGTVSIPAGATLTIGAGTIVRCAPGVEFWVRAGAGVQVNGTTAAPVVFVPDNTNNLWGGFWLQPQSGANVATLTATGAIFCCWGANQNWYTTPAGEPARSFPHHRNQQPCVATAAGAVCTLTDCALVGPTLLHQTRGAAFATNDGSLIFTRVLAQRCITGGEQEDCPVFELDSCAFIEMNEPATDVDSDTFNDADNDGLYLVPSGNIYNIRKTLIGWTKDDGIDTGADGDGSMLCYDCWFENCVHEAISNSGVDRVPQSHRGVHFNCGQGMECGYGGPHSLVKDCVIAGCMVGARYGDNYGNDNGSNGSGTSQYLGDITADGSFLLYNYFHDAWAIDFSFWTYSNNKFTLRNTKLTNAGDLAAQNGAEDTGNSLWNPAADGVLLAPYMPTPGSSVGVDFPVLKRQDGYTAWPASFPVRLSTFSSQQVTAGWRVTGKTAPEAATETLIASGTLTWQPGETLKTFTAALPSPNSHGVILVSLDAPVKAEITGSPLLFFPAAGPVVPDLNTIPKNAPGWNYHAALPPANWNTATPWPPLDASSRSWTHPQFAESGTWYSNRPAPLGWGTIDTTAGTLAFGTAITERPVTVYARKTFTVANPFAVKSLRVECLADDGASVYINGTRVNPTTWGLDPATQVGGSIYYNQLSTRFRSNGSSEGNYDVLTLTGPTLPALNAAPALNVLAVEVHQNSTDSSDCALDCALTIVFSPPVNNLWGIGGSANGGYLYWTNPAWTLQTSGDFGTWTNRYDLASPVPMIDLPRSIFYRLQIPEE